MAMKTTTNIKRGDRILTEKPFVYVLQSKYRQQRCDNCLAQTKVLKCSNCNYVYYCNRACQMQAWPWHKLECPLLKHIYPRIVPDAARMLCRIILKLQSGGDLEKGYYTDTCYRKFRDLMSHYQEIKNDPKRVEHLESLHVVLSVMMEKSSVVLPNQTELLSIYGRLITNGFNILDDDMNTIATAIYLGVSIMDHSCQPNAVATFEGTTLHIHVTEDMECLDWSKIFISYIDLLNTTEERRQHLKDNYYFWCSCSRCIDTKETIDALAARCPNRICLSPLDITSNNCAYCNASVSSKYRTEYEEALSFTKNQLDDMKDVTYLDVCKICLVRLDDYVHPLNIWIIKIMDAAFEAAIKVGHWSEALVFGPHLIPGFQKYYGAWNPLLGLLYLKMGKILLHKNRPKDALCHFQKAQKILIITHGQDHTLLQTILIPMLHQAMDN